MFELNGSYSDVQKTKTKTANRSRFWLPKVGTLDETIEERCMESMLLTDDIIDTIVSLVNHMFLVDMQFPVQQFTADSKSFPDHNATPGSVEPLEIITHSQETSLTFNLYPTKIEAQCLHFL